MTVYEKMQSDKVFCASMLSRAYNSADYEDDDFDPAMMDVLDKPYTEIEEDHD